MTSRLDEMKAWLGLGPADEAALAALAEALAPALGPMVDDFYARILADREARVVLRDPAAVARLKQSLRAWAARLFRGPFDAAYAEERRVIGHRHVQVALPQRFMPLAMQTISEHLKRVAEERHAGDPAARRAALLAIDRALALELTMMLDAYQESTLELERQRERFSTITQLAAGVSHELKNPLGVINISTMLLRRMLDTGEGDFDREAARVQLDRVARSSRQAADLANQLLDYARIRRPVPQSIPLAALLAAVLERLGENPGVTVESHVEPPGAVFRADPSHLERVLLNLTRNAVQSITENGRGSRVAIRLRVAAGAGGRPATLELEVTDDGPGVAVELRDRVFAPLFTTREQGTGLGLAICRELVEAAGGRIATSPAPGGGATFRVTLPDAPAPPRAQPPGSAAAD